MIVGENDTIFLYIMNDMQTASTDYFNYICTQLKKNLVGTLKALNSSNG